MAKPTQPVPGAAQLQAEIDFYVQMVPLHDFLPINVDVRSAREATMVSALGSPRMALTTTDQPDHASPLVTSLKQTAAISAHVIVTGIKPAIASLKSALGDVFATEAKGGHDLASVLGTEGMLNVRLRKPTSGTPSTQISNHSWGTAVDFKIVGQNAPGNTHDMIPRFIAVMLSAFNKAGWYSGIGFHDTMHFEVSDALIQKWAKDGLLKP